MAWCRKLVLRGAECLQNSQYNVRANLGGVGLEISLFGGITASSDLTPMCLQNVMPDPEYVEASLL
jgi:hypothetical protein